jgi:tripartite ATP-independent transporter DctM subunit
MIWLALLLIPLALLGTPLFAIIGALAALLFVLDGQQTSNILIETYRLTGQSVLVAIPLFTFAGYAMAESGTPHRLVRVSRAFLGWLPGGLAIVALISCAFFTAFTGASGVTIIALGGLLMPAMVQDKYPEKFSLGLLTTSGSLGLLFAPSLAIIIYGYVSGAPIDQLFLAGILPGILLISLLSIYSFVKGYRSKIPRTPFRLGEIKDALWEAKWEIPLPIIVVLGIYRGWFTAAEAAAVAAFYVLIVEVFFYKDLHLKRDVPRVMRESMVLVGGILIILGVALGLTNYLIFAEVPDAIFNWIQNYIHSKIVFLIVLNIFLLIVGCMMDIFSAIVVVVPLIIPLAERYGIHPVHLGIIFLTNLEIGYSTPPVGINLFIGSFRFKKPIINLYAASLPFLVLYIIALLIITYWPDLSLMLLPEGAQMIPVPD